MKSDVLWWTFYFYICYVQRTESVRIFQNLVTPPSIWYTKYKPSVTSKTCMLIPDNGPCRDVIPMWYYEPKISNCTLFDWGGCQGNGNSFRTFAGCLGFCMSKEGTKNRPRYCSLSFDYGFCFGSVPRWFYDPRWKVCKSTIYSGCGGNKNNFYNKEQCDQICRFGNPPLDSGVTAKRGNKKVLIINPESTTISIRASELLRLTAAPESGATANATNPA